MTKEAVNRINSTLKSGDPSNHENALYDSITNKVFVPRRSKGGNTVENDYGIILKTKNPFAPEKQILIAYGSFGFGTWAAVRFVLSKEFLKDHLVMTGKSIECLVEADVAFDTPQHVRSLVSREL